jgi:hypothetical protein
VIPARRRETMKRSDVVVHGPLPLSQLLMVPCGLNPKLVAKIFLEVHSVVGGIGRQP